MTAENQIPASQEAQAAVDAALGLESITVRMPSRDLRRLEREAALQGLPTVALARNMLSALGAQLDAPSSAHGVVLEVIAERVRQDAKWGGPAQDDQHDLEEFCNIINQRTLAMARGFETKGHARKRMIQIAALAVAAVESMDRKKRLHPLTRTKATPDVTPVTPEEAHDILSNTTTKIAFKP